MRRVRCCHLMAGTYSSSSFSSPSLCLTHALGSLPGGKTQVKIETFQHFMADNGKCAVGIILIARTRSLGAVSNFLYFRAGDPESKVKENQREQNAAALRVSSSREEILKRIS